MKKNIVLAVVVNSLNGVKIEMDHNVIIASCVAQQKPVKEKV